MLYACISKYNFTLILWQTVYILFGDKAASLAFIFKNAFDFSVSFVHHGLAHFLWMRAVTFPDIVFSKAVTFVSVHKEGHVYSARDIVDLVYGN